MIVQFHCCPVSRNSLKNWLQEVFTFISKRTISFHKNKKDFVPKNQLKDNLFDWFKPHTNSMREDKNSALITFDVQKAFDPVWVDDLSKKWMTNICLFNRKDTRTEEICLQLHQRHDQQPHWRYEHRWSTYLHWWICSAVSNGGIRWVESFTTMPKSYQSGQLQKNTIGNNILAELHSIHHALRTVFTHFKNNTIKEIIVLTDCQTAIKIINNTLTFNTNTNQSNWFITSEIIKVTKFLRSVGIKVKCDWTRKWQAEQPWGFIGQNSCALFNFICQHWLYS